MVLDKAPKEIFQKTYSLGEEIANGITHGIGLALSVAGLTLLVVLAALHGDAWKVTSFSIYGSTLILLYLASTLYHSFPNPRVKRILKIIDHSAIFLLIAGTYTPFMLVNMRGPWGWSLFVTIWVLAIAGVVMKAFFIHRFRRLSTLVYVLMGWLCVVAVSEMIATIPFNGLMWLAVGGLCYTIGVIFYLWHRLPYHHAIWHLFVLGGSICHFFAVLFSVLPAAS
ncbi:MAG: hemolysin III family protein [Calditrichaeota bacterium]|nr:hemolysin III family protein [Calditrichota bacterium]